MKTLIQNAFVPYLFSVRFFIFFSQSHPFLLFPGYNFTLALRRPAQSKDREEKRREDLETSRLNFLGLGFRGDYFLLSNKRKIQVLPTHGF